MGPCTSLDALYRDQRPLFRGSSEIFFQPHRILTEAQRLASDQVLAFMQDSAAEKALLWAACGAGKTEVCFPSAAWALKKGKSVLFAAPRQDVIHDVAPRLERNFPGYPLQVLTGTAKVRFQRGNMVLATTHQVLRFWRAFDVIFMDEMDAFPYHGDQALQWGLNHALRQGGKMLYLTATPSPEGLKAVQQGKMHLIRLPARHHRNPLPVPIWEKSYNSLHPDGCAESFYSLIESLREQGPVLVFVPKISWLHPWIECFRCQFPSWRVDGSYSADPSRSIKLECLRQGRFDLFVSTTILERGITLSGIQVVVLEADHSVYDERALVQMAGRAGRTREHPDGRVIFISGRRTPAINKAIKWIEEQNRWALELGLIERGD
jgi:Superfamily II DNA/RNA helicase required for DNA uptake (late competence protein)